jgi:hypothetical protein
MAQFLGQVYQDADESISRTILWLLNLNGSTISTASWSVSPELTTDGTSSTTLTTSIRLSGGVPSRTYPITCTVTTAASETLQAYFKLTIDD